MRNRRGCRFPSRSRDDGSSTHQSWQALYPAGARPDVSVTVQKDGLQRRSGCAPDLEKRVDHNLTFEQLKTGSDSYKGRVVVLEEACCPAGA